MGLLDAKLDLVLEAVKKGNSHEIVDSDEEDVMKGWSEEIAEAWQDVKGRGRARQKPTKPTKPIRKPRESSSTSSDESVDRLEKEGETKNFARKKYYPKDYKFKRSEEIVQVCVKTVDRVISEGDDQIPALKHLKFVSEKVSKGCFDFEAVAGYDQAVRERVALDGYAQFAVIESFYPIFGGKYGKKVGVIVKSGQIQAGVSEGQWYLF